MKSTKILLLPALALTLSMSIDPIDDSLYISTVDIYGPFTSSENSYFTFRASGLHKSVHGNIKGYKNNNYVFNRDFDFVDDVSEEVNISTKNRITTSGIRLDMKFTDDKGKSFVTSATIYPPLQTSITANKQTVTYGGSILGIESNTLINEERYSFLDTNNYYSLASGNRIDISEISFSYSPLKKYYCDSAYLEIVDNKNIYPDLKRTLQNEVRFPIKTIIKNDEISFEFNINLYVNYSTLEMSMFSQSGFELTQDLYLPLGKEDLLEDETARIVIEGSGFNRNKITIPLTFFRSSRLFGSCDDSDYCIHGGIKKWYCYF